MIEILIPKDLDLEAALEFCESMWKLDHSDTYEFDFKNLSHVEPFTMAYVANEMKRFRRSKESCKFQAKNYKGKSYPAHMGFFQAFGLDYGNHPGEASGSNTYVPLTILNTRELKIEAADNFIRPGELLEEKSKKIAQILTRKKTGDLVDTLTFSIREILRNIIEHSRSEIIEYCAQYWPSQKTVEVAILDTGLGIKAGLSSNPFLTEMKTERDAVYLSLLPGISGKMYKGVKKREDDEWQNSGYGLYMTNRICRNGGDFLIVSNDFGVLLDSDSKRDFHCPYKGVALRLRIDTRGISDYSKMLKQYRDEGYAKSKDVNQGEAILPSVASTMLTRDFAS